MKKRLLAIVLCLAMMLSVLVACNQPKEDTQPSETNTGSVDETPDPSETTIANVLDERTVKVAILDNMWNDRSADAMKACGGYLEDNFNCQFEYITIDDTSAQSVIAGTENAITMGCEIILSCVGEGLEQSCNIAQQAGAAFCFLNCTPRDEDFPIIEKYDNYICTLCPPLDGYATGYDLAGQLISEGHDNFAIVTFTPGLLTAVDDQTAGFVARCEEEDANLVYKLEEMPGPTMITAVSTMLETYGSEIDYIAAFGGGTNFVVPALTALNLNIPLAVPSIPTDYETYFNAGMLDYVMGYSDDAVALAFAMGINYLNGVPASGLTEDRTIETCFVVLRSMEDIQTYDKLSQGLDGNDPTFNAEEIKSMITAYNPDATFEYICEMAQSVDLEGIQARH